MTSVKVPRSGFVRENDEQHRFITSPAGCPNETAKVTFVR